jgi:hypothetical protein
MRAVVFKTTFVTAAIIAVAGSTLVIGWVGLALLGF